MMGTTEIASLELFLKESQELSEVYQKDAEDLEIVSEGGLELAAEIKKHITDQMDIIKESFELHKANAYKAHKDLCLAEKTGLLPYEKAMALLKPKVLKWQNAEREKQRLEQERIDKENREAEAKAKKEAQEEKDKEVEALMDAGDLEKAEMVQDAPVVTPAPTYYKAPTTTAPKGVGTKTVWKGKVLNFAKMSDQFKVKEQTVINKYAQLMKKNAKDPGIEFYEEEQFSGK